jgi:hypothetical protein
MNIDKDNIVLCKRDKIGEHLKTPSAPTCFSQMFAVGQKYVN